MTDYSPGFYLSIATSSLILVGGAGYAAYQRGKSPWPWMAYALVLWPVAAIVICIDGENERGEAKWGRLTAAAFLGVSLLTAILVGAVARVGPIEFYRILTGGFTDENVAAVKASIKTEFEKRPGAHVVEISMVHESGSKLIGYVKIMLDGRVDKITKSCEATSSDGQLLWSCN